MPRAQLWYVVVCGQCDSLVMPFTDKGDRFEWAQGHVVGTGHMVTLAEQIGYVA